MATLFTPPLSSSSSFPPFKQSSPAGDESGGGDSSSSSSYVSLSPSLYVISAIIAFVFCASAFIHLLLRFLSTRSRHSTSFPPLPPSLLQRRNYGSSSSSSTTAAILPAGLSNQDKAAIIDSLPLFTLAALPGASSDCAVCLYPFRPRDVLRLLPACRHAFHSRCLDPWLRSTPTCPLCRSSVAIPASPLPHPAPFTSRSGSYRVEIGSVSRREAPLETELAAGNPQTHLRTYSLGSSFEYVVDDQVEAVVELIGTRTEKEEKQEDVAVQPASSEAEAAPPVPVVAEAAGGSGGGGRGWRLRDYVDRFSGRWSHRCDGSSGGRSTWDLEGSWRREAEDGGHSGFYGWIVRA